MTNYERIKAMSVEEFAEKFASRFPCRLCEGNDSKIPCGANCKEHFSKWLNTAVKEKPNDKDK